MKSIHTLLTSGKGRLEAVYPALLAILNNIAPHVENLARATSSKLVQLFASMSAPSFLFANESNHTLLQSLLEALNAIVEHQYRSESIFRYTSSSNIAGNPNVTFAILRTKKRFYALREFTLEGGQQELERQAQLRKEQQDAASRDRSNSIDGNRSPTSIRSPNLSNVPEESGAFAIGDDEDSDDDDDTTVPLRRRSTAASIDSPREASMSASTEEMLPQQLRGMSEKARGKMPAGQPSFSRTNSISSLHSIAPTATHPGQFQPTAEWVRTSQHQDYVLLTRQ